MNSAIADVKPLQRTPSRVEQLLAFAQKVLRSVRVQRRKRSMSLCETLPMGEKRFLAIVEIDRQRLLIAATTQSIALLQRLDSSGEGTCLSNIHAQNSTEGWH